MGFKTRTASPAPGDSTAIGFYNWDGTCYSIPPHRKRIIVGRADGEVARVDVALDDPEVSSLHCIIERADDGQFAVSDSSSKNGTFINDVHLLEGKARWRPGDTLRVGQTKLQIMGADGPYFGPPPHSVEQIQAALRFHKSMRRTAKGLGTTFHQVRSRLGATSDDEPDADDGQDS